MTLNEDLEFMDRARKLGFSSALEYARYLEAGLRSIADAESGVWGRVASDVLRGLLHLVPIAHRAPPRSVAPDDAQDRS